MKKVLSVFLCMVLAVSVYPTVAFTTYAIGNYGVNINGTGYVTTTKPFIRQSWDLYGQCTWYCWGRAYEKGVNLSFNGGHFGNAKDWYNNAQGNYICDNNASANSIMVSPDGKLSDGTVVGHVMFVEKVENGYAYITEANYWSSDAEAISYNGHNGRYHEDRIQLSTGKRTSNGSRVNITGYIHLEANDPIGHADEIVGGDGEVFIRGWAFDYNDPGASLQLHVYIGGYADDPDAEVHTGIYADGDRPDINNSYNVPGNHGYKTYIKTNKTGGQYVCIYAINKGEGNNVLIGREWVSISSHNPVGHADEINGGEGQIFIRGWAFDYDDPGASLELNVYIGGDRGSADAEVHEGIIANGDRTDINSSYSVPGDHGYKTYIQTDKVGEQYVYIYALNKGAGNDSLIAEGLVNITHHSPIGHADEIVGGDGEVFIRGWAFDPDEPGTSIQLHVYIGGSAGDPTSEPHTGIYANGDRQDINDSYGIPGDHGFKTSISTDKRGWQKVYIYGINIGEGSNIPHFAEAEVYINPPHQHSYTSVVTAPTCTKRGYTTHTCACGDSYVDTYVAALGHQWDSGTITVAPTTTTPGIVTYTCTACGEERMEIVPKLETMKGDADGDGAITVADALAALRIAAKLAEETPEMVAICDTDGDGEITVADALKILRVAAKMVDSL